MTLTRRILITLFILQMTSAAAFSQGLRLVVSDKPLNEVLNTLGVEVSYDDRAMSAYRVTVSQTFQNTHEALLYLLHDKPYKVEKIGNVYVVSPAPKLVEQRRTFIYSGILSDHSDGERLPYAYIQAGRNVYITDKEGAFSFQNESGNAQRVNIQYLGYEAMDTVMHPGQTRLQLKPKPLEIGSVTITPAPVAMMMQSGYTSGETRINHRIARFMPGSPDNSVFTLLRMMPGVRASGEPSEDLIVWGSGPGESRILFDGYTLFGMKNFNDHISSVNPYMVKDIRLMRSGYGVVQGGNVGAVAEITGIEGNTAKPTVKATVSNYTANIFASLPITKRSVLSAAYRQTLYNLYGNSGYSPSGEQDEVQSISDIYIRPHYDFRDANLKYSGKTRGGDSYYVSLYGADDRFNFKVEQDGQYAVDAREKNYQYAGATGYDKFWRNGAISSLRASYSKYSAAIDNVTSVGEGADNKLVKTRTDNDIEELTVKLNHSLNIGSHQRLTAGAEFTQFTNRLNSQKRDINVPAVFVTDNISLGKLSVEAGVRMDIPSSGNPGLSPRITARHNITEELTATASWGIYRQYISKIPYQYSTGHFEMVWSLSDSTFMRAYHTLAGLAFSRNGWLLSAEGYLRQTHNGLYFLDNSVYASDNTVIGGDLFAKKEFRQHTVFASYSIAGMRKPVKETSHEIKIGGVSSVGNFYFSANYVFGTGFSYLSTSGHNHGQEGDQGHEQEEPHGHDDDTESHTYNRFDIAVTYRLKRDKWQLQAGISLLNVFNNRNIKYSYQLNDQNRVTNIYTKAATFTPMAFVEINF